MHIYVYVCTCVYILTYVLEWKIEGHVWSFIWQAWCCDSPQYLVVEVAECEDFLLKFSMIKNHNDKWWQVCQYPESFSPWLLQRCPELCKYDCYGGPWSSLRIGLLLKSFKDTKRSESLVHFTLMKYVFVIYVYIHVTVTVTVTATACAESSRANLINSKNWAYTYM